MKGILDRLTWAVVISRMIKTGKPGNKLDCPTSPEMDMHTKIAVTTSLLPVVLQYFKFKMETRWDIKEHPGMRSSSIHAPRGEGRPASQQKGQ
jgi:hypothetical protein